MIETTNEEQIERLNSRIAELLAEVAVLKRHAQCAPLREALERSVVAIDDWLHIYASEHCSDDRVEEAEARVYEHGTLWYIASVQDQNRAALSSTECLPKGE